MCTYLILHIKKKRGEKEGNGQHRALPQNSIKQHEILAHWVWWSFLLSGCFCYTRSTVCVALFSSESTVAIMHNEKNTKRILNNFSIYVVLGLLCFMKSQQIVCCSRTRRPIGAVQSDACPCWQGLVSNGSKVWLKGELKADLGNLLSSLLLKCIILHKYIMEILTVICRVWRRLFLLKLNSTDPRWRSCS